MKSNQFGHVALANAKKWEKVVAAFAHRQVTNRLPKLWPETAKTVSRLLANGPVDSWPTVGYCSSLNKKKKGISENRS